MHQYQREGVGFALALRKMQTPGCLIADEMGLGKTIQALAVSKHLFATSSRGVKVAVVVPGYLRSNWKSEISKFDILPSQGVEVLMKLKDAPGDSSEHKITIISYKWMSDNQHLLHGYDLLVFDEAHMLKNAYHTRDRDNSGRYVAAKKLVPNVGFSLFLTGTPAPNCPRELYSLLHLTSSLGSMKWAEYAFRYCERYFSTMFFGWEDGNSSAEQELQDLQQFACVRRLAKDWLGGLPDEMRSFVTLPLHTGKANLKRIAREREELLKQLQGNSLTDHERKKTADKLQQNRSQAFVASAKAKKYSFRQYFRQYLEDRPFDGTAPPLLVFAHHKETIDMLSEMFDDLGVSNGVVYGNNSKKTNDENIQSFKDGGLDVLLMSIVMAVGHNLQRASTAFFAEVYWSPGGLAQAEKRIHRQGSEHARVHYVYLFGESPAICAEVYRKCLEKSAKLEQAVRTQPKKKRRTIEGATCE